MTLSLRLDLLPVINSFKHIENIAENQESKSQTIQKKTLTDRVRIKKSENRDHDVGHQKKVERHTKLVPTVIAKENRPDDIKLSNNLTKDSVKIACRICERSYKLSMFYSHIKDTHSFSLAHYQEKYGSFYDHIKPTERTYHECKLCGDFVLLDMSELDVHIKQAGHQIKNSDYIATYCQEKNRGSKRKQKKAQVGPAAKVSKSEVSESPTKLKQTSRSDTNIRKTLQLSEIPPLSSTNLPHNNSVEKISNLGQLSNFDLDALLKAVEKDPRAVSASDLLKAYEIIVID